MYVRKVADGGWWSARYFGTMNSPAMNAPLLNPHPVRIQIGTRKHAGHFFVGQQAVYYVSSGSASALWGAVGGVAGAVAQAVAEKDINKGANPNGPMVEQQVYEFASQSQDGMVFMANEVNEIKYTMMMRCIKHNGKTIGFGQGLPKPLRAELREWAQRNGVKVKGKL